MFSLLLVPPPDVNIAMNPSSGPIIEGTVLNLTCTTTISSFVTTTVNVISVWTNSLGQVVSTTNSTLLPENIGTYENSLIFNPVVSKDTGEYVCEIRITSSNDFLIDGVGNATINFTVDGKINDSWNV